MVCLLSDKDRKTHCDKTLAPAECNSKCKDKSLSDGSFSVCVTFYSSPASVGGVICDSFTEEARRTLCQDRCLKKPYLADAATPEACAKLVKDAKICLGPKESSHDFTGRAVGSSCGGGGIGTLKLNDSDSGFCSCEVSKAQAQSDCQKKAADAQATCLLDGFKLSSVLDCTEDCVGKSPGAKYSECLAKYSKCDDCVKYNGKDASSGKTCCKSESGCKVGGQCAIIRGLGGSSFRGTYIQSPKEDKMLCCVSPDDTQGYQDSWACPVKAGLGSGPDFSKPGQDLGKFGENALAYKACREKHLAELDSGSGCCNQLGIEKCRVGLACKDRYGNAGTLAAPDTVGYLPCVVKSACEQAIAKDPESHRLCCTGAAGCVVGWKCSYDYRDPGQDVGDYYSGGTWKAYGKHGVSALICEGAKR